MSNVAKLKKKAAELELKKQFDKALAVYVELLDDFDEHANELDVALFNRVGDILLRQGNVADAVDYYEKAVDHYAEGGFFNNAIALCNKILRHSPGRTSVYYKLGKISAQKGFKNDAKQNFLEYADRMQKTGRIDEAFRALTEFADLCPDQDDIRLMLAEQLSKADRKAEAVEQLQLLYSRYTSEGRAGEAAAAAERMKAIDPTAEPRASGGERRESTRDLVFLDLDDASPPRRASITELPPVARPRPAAPPPAVPAAPPDLPIIDAMVADRADAFTTDVEPDVEPVVDDTFQVTRGIEVDGSVVSDAAPLDGLELTHSDEPMEAAPGSILDLEPTSFGISDDTADAAGDLDLVLPAGGLETHTPRSSGEILAELEPPLLRGDADAPVDASTFAASDEAAPDLLLLDFELPSSVPSTDPARRASAAVPELTLADDLDVVDVFDVGMTGESPAVEDEQEEAAAGALLELILPDDEVDADEDLAVDADVGIEADVPPATRRRSTMFAAQSVEILRASVEGEPENWNLRRELAEAMLDSGDREGGIHELEMAMGGAEHSNDLDLAARIAEEIARIDPGTIRHLQKRVEYAFRTNDKPRLIEAYLALGEALGGTAQIDKARAVYQRVLGLAPDDIRAQAALEALPEPEPEPTPVPAPTARRSTVAMKQPAMTPRGPAPVAPASEESFINLGDLMRDEVGPADTRMIVDEHEPTGDEEADFQDMLRKFKQGIAQNVEQEDYQSHYDLGIAFKEMGLLDEAVAEFQKALRSPTNRVPAYESLGQCFIEKEQYSIAATVLSRALHEEGISDDHLVGVLYLLGRAAEALDRNEDALTYYQRVFLVDIQFRDIAERISGVERAVR